MSPRVPSNLDLTWTCAAPPRGRYPSKGAGPCLSLARYACLYLPRPLLRADTPLRRSKIALAGAPPGGRCGRMTRGITELTQTERSVPHERDPREFRPDSITARARESSSGVEAPGTSQGIVSSSAVP